MYGVTRVVGTHHLFIFPTQREADRFEDMLYAAKYHGVVFQQHGKFKTAEDAMDALEKWNAAHG